MTNVYVSATFGGGGRRPDPGARAEKLRTSLVMPEPKQMVALTGCSANGRQIRWPYPCGHHCPHLCHLRDPLTASVSADCPLDGPRDMCVH
jgi:hypothetical protein